MLQAHMTDDKKVEVKDMKGEIVYKMLKYIYSGKTEGLNEADEKDMLFAAEKFHVFDLKKKLIDSISARINMKNVFESLILAHNYNEEILLKNCVAFIKA
jgi:hypothetical protein